MTRYNVAYVFEVRVLTSHGRGKASQLYYAVPEFSGMPTQFILQGHIIQRWSLCVIGHRQQMSIQMDFM